MIPVYTPLFKGNEKKYLQQCIDTSWVSSDGYFVRKFEEEFAKWSGNRYAITVCNGTAALETALWASRACNYWSISIPNSTIISCVLAAFRLNTIPILYDYNPIDTIPLMRCHLFGKFCNYENKLIIDDASQYWKPFKVQDVACYSLYANKMITSGEGGVIVTNNKGIYERAKLYRNLAHTKERFIHSDFTYNFRMSNLQAAVALAQLEQIDKFIAIKQKNRDLYKKYLPDNVIFKADVEVPWMYLVQSNKLADKIVKGLIKRGVDCRRYFYPLNKQPPMMRYSSQYEDTFIFSDYFWEHYFYLPSGLTLTEKEIKFICQSLKSTLRYIT